MSCGRSTAPGRPRGEHGGSSVAAPAQISTDHPALATGLVSAGVAAAGLVAATLTVWAVHRSPVLVDAHNAAILRGLFVASYGGIGIYTWRRRPASRLGPLFIGVGFLYALLTLNASSEPLPNTIGRALLGAPIVAVVSCWSASRGTGWQRRPIAAS